MWNNKCRPNKLGKREQLCWSCTRENCDWNDYFLPVPGWDAERDEDSYRIYDCPNFQNIWKLASEFNDFSEQRTHLMKIRSRDGKRISEHIVTVTREDFEKFKDRIVAWREG